MQRYTYLQILHFIGMYMFHGLYLLYPLYLVSYTYLGQKLEDLYVDLTNVDKNKEYSYPILA